MLHRMLDESGLRIGGILTDLFGLSGRNLLDGLVAGHDPEQMVAGVKGNARKKIPALLDALGKGLNDGAKPLVVLLRDMLDAVERSLADLERHILDAVRRNYELPWTLLQTLPGTGPLAAATLLAEVGDDMDAFGTARRLASWAGMCSGNHESAGKSKGGKRRKGNVYLRRILCEIAHAAARTHDVQFGPYKQHLAKRRGVGRASRGDSAQDPAHRVRDAARRPAVPRPADRPRGADGRQEQGALAEDAAQGESAAGGRSGRRAVERRAGPRPRCTGARADGRPRARRRLNGGRWSARG